MAARGSKGDTGRNELIRVGATIAALAQIFAKDDKSVQQAIARNTVPAIIAEDGRELYPIRAVAPYLIDVSKAIDIEAMLKSVSLKKLPPELSKNFWEAANARKKHLEDNGELWRTDAVMEVFVDVFKALRQSITQFTDTVADRTEITEKQRQMLLELGDGLLASMRETLIEQFELYTPEARERDTHDNDSD